jgi:N-acetylglucosaminyldiphosphoundecaprenol N-acetyl-beta-D-mannosaminyltransferase
VSDRCAVVMGLPIDDVTISEAVDRIAAMVEVGRATGRSHQVATVNVDFVVNAVGDPDTLRILQHSDLAIPDGMPVVWGARLLGSPLRERTPGVDLLPALVKRSADAGYRICLFGAAPGVAEKAAAWLTGRFPGADVTGLAAPDVGRDGTMDPAALEPIRAVRPDIVGVALGNPKQERWIARHARSLGAPVLIGIGGTLDFLTGVTRRAPHWMQRTGLEWLHRAASEPQRLAGRYARDVVVFLPGLLAQAWRGRRRSSTVLPLVTTDGSSTTMQVLGPLRDDLIVASGAGTIPADRILTVDVSALTMLDNPTVAALAGLLRSARRTGTRVSVVGFPPRLDASARRLNVAGLLVAADPAEIALIPDANGKGKR